MSEIIEAFLVKISHRATFGESLTLIVLAKSLIVNSLSSTLGGSSKTGVFDPEILRLYLGYYPVIVTDKAAF